MLNRKQDTGTSHELADYAGLVVNVTPMPEDSLMERVRGSTTTPGPIRLMVPGCRTPEGTR